MTTTAQQLAQARQKLLDLTMRNHLLNYKPSKQRSVPVVGESPVEVYETLVIKEKPLTFRPTQPRRLPRTVDLGERYGSIASGFIHVHHLVPPSEIRKTYRLDPVRDLRPICPKCYSVLHLQRPPLSIAEARKLLREP